ncbi:hypothetical protein pb186bvf_000234 [Paramecium bursaria]
MSLSEKSSQFQFQKNQIDLQNEEPELEQGYQNTKNKNSGAIQSKQSTSNEYRKQLSDQKQPLNYEGLTNIYDLEQLNYRVFMNKEYERSFRLQLRLMKIIDKNPEYYHQHSLTYLALNDIDNAQLWYDQSTQICPYYVRYFFDYVEYLPKEFVDSIKYIKNNIDCYKDQANQLIAECLFAYNVFLSQRPQKAMKMLTKLIERYPKCYLPYFYTSKCYYHNQDYTLSLEFINLAIINFRYKDIQLYNLKGKIQIQRRDFEDAMRIYSLFPDNKYFKFQVEKLENIISMETIQQEKRSQKALIKKLGKKEQQLYDKGINFYKLWQYEESRDCFLIAIEKYPNNGLFQFMIAKCYFKLGDFKNAQNHSNFAGTYFEDKERLEKLVNKIQNEIKRSEKSVYNTCGLRQFYLQNYYIGNQKVLNLSVQNSINWTKSSKC